MTIDEGQNRRSQGLKNWIGLLEQREKKSVRRSEEAEQGPHTHTLSVKVCAAGMRNGVKATRWSQNEARMDDAEQLCTGSVCVCVCESSC